MEYMLRVKNVLHRSLVYTNGKNSKKKNEREHFDKKRFKFIVGEPFNSCEEMFINSPRALHND
jgi:hypothetical protein